MSAPRTVRRTVAAASAAVVAVVLLGLGGSAAADPPALNVDPCSEALSQVTAWPGMLGDGSTHFSDAYETYLFESACTPVS